MRVDRVGVGIGLFFIAAGTLFLLEGLDVFRVRAAWVWPLLLIGFGLALLAGGIRRPAPEPAPAPRTEEPPPPHVPAEEEPPAETSDRIEEREEREDRSS